jgi:hypothetical protein
MKTVLEALEEAIATCDESDSEFLNTLIEQRNTLVGIEPEDIEHIDTSEKWRWAEVN